MSKHTPGPWTAEEDDTTDSDGTQFQSPFPWLIESNTCTVAGVSGIGAEAEANARLIAAAPDLLEAIKALLSISPFDDCFDPVGLALKAIEKAEGR